jgi:hypothetical protein
MTAFDLRRRSSAKTARSRFVFATAYSVVRSYFILALCFFLCPSAESSSHAFHLFNRSALDQMGLEDCALAISGQTDSYAIPFILDGTLRIEMQERVRSFLSAGVLSAVERAALREALEGPFLPGSAEAELLSNYGTRAQAEALKRAVRRARAFFWRANLPFSPDIASRAEAVQWIQAEVSKRGWSESEAANAANLVEPDRLLLNVLLQSVETGTPLEAESDRVFDLVSKLVPAFNRSRALLPRQGESTVAPLPEPTLFSAFGARVTAELATRKWDCSSLPFLGLSQNDAALVETVLGSDTPNVLPWKPGEIARILTALTEAFRKYPPGTYSAAPRAKETVRDWLTRELTSRQLLEGLDRENGALWSQSDLGTSTVRKEILSALSSSGPFIFSKYTKVKLLKFFRQYPPQARSSEDR